MAKQINKKNTYVYSFTATGSVQCTVDGGSVEIWINTNTANTYTSTGQASSKTFGPVSKTDNTTWNLNLKGNDLSNSTVTVSAPTLGTWNPAPSDT